MAEEVKEVIEATEEVTVEEASVEEVIDSLEISEPTDSLSFVEVLDFTDSTLSAQPSIVYSPFDCVLHDYFIDKAFHFDCNISDSSAVYFPDSGVIAKNVEIELVTSRDKLESYQKSVLFFNAKDEVMEKLDSYSSEFFDTKMLIVINMTEPISNSNIIVEKVDFGDSKVTVTIKRESPDIGAEMIKHWTVFVEIEARDIEKVDYTIVEKRIS